LEILALSTEHELQAQYDVGIVARWIGFTAACIGMFMAILDIQVVVTSLAVIEQALEIGADNMSWVQTSYIIAEVVAIPLTGLLMRVFSMRWLFVLALSGFTLASIGCALSVGFLDLLVWRVFQGFAGGVLIPIVFSSIFLLFPKGQQQTLATTLGGLLAVLAPALGPLVGGWITEHYSWHWLFLINVAPGIISICLGALTLPKARINFRIFRELDWLALLAFGLSLAFLIIGLKEAPKQGWLSPLAIVLFGLFASCLAFSVVRPNSPILFNLLRDKSLAFGCFLSFVLGFGLFSAVYILPVFLAFVRNHGPLQIGLITLVMGVAQVLSAPAIVQADRFFNARWLAAIGFSGFAIGMFMNAGMTVNSDYNEVFWPQILRGLAIALCILPPIRMALGLLPIKDVNDASGLFNLVRNIGGAIGIAIMDTIMFERGPILSERLMDLINSDPGAAAAALGIPIDEVPGADDPTAMMSILDLVQAASLTQAINECWIVLGVVTLFALPALLLVGPIRSAIPSYKLIKFGENPLR
jgi:MFS transporter, DHA2 family, multidrug resistance protein